MAEVEVSLQAEISQFNDRAALLKQYKADMEASEAIIRQNSIDTAAFLERSRIAADAREANPGGGNGTVPTGFVPRGVVVEGASTESGGGSNTVPWPSQYATQTGVPVTNISRSGDSVDNMRDQYDAGAGTMFSATTRDTFILNPGKNDMQNNGASDAYVRGVTQLIAGKAKATGYKVYVTTLTPSVDPAWTAQMETYRTNYNTWMRANWQNFADGLIDFANAITTADLWDTRHPSNAGSAKLATAVLNAFNGVATTPGNVTDDAITINGAIDPVKYAALELWNDAGIAYRYGLASAPIANAPTWFERETKYMPVGDVRGYQIGEYTAEEGDYASNVLHVGWTPDDPVARIGVSDLQGTSVGHHVITLKPEISWTRYKKLPDALDGYEPRIFKDAGKRVRNPVAMGHALGRSGWSVKTGVVFDDGSFCFVGANTMTNLVWGQLPPGMKPTGLAITSSNEFMLITVWDTTASTPTGRVFVIYLCGLGNDRTIENPLFVSANGNEGWWGEANEPHPGMHNLGNIAFAKIAGSVVLPGMAAPTEITATTGHHRYRYLNGSGANETMGNTANWKASETQRQRWITGDYSDRYARQGMALIASKTENELLFLDLKPLFDYMNSMYFNPDRNKFLETTNVGQGAGQWPYTFAERPQQMPTVIKTIVMQSKPTSVLLYQYTLGSTPKRAYVGTEDGRVHLFDLGGYPQSGTPDQIKEIDSVFIGGNVVSIAPLKEKAVPGASEIMGTPDLSFVAGSRDLKAAVFFDLTNNGNSLLVRRTFQDSRVQDLLRVEDHDNHGTTQFSCSIADHKGKQVHNFRYGPLKMTTYEGQVYGMGADGTAKFEYSGSFLFPGKPWWNGTANIS